MSFTPSIRFSIPERSIVQIPSLPASSIFIRAITKLNIPEPCKELNEWDFLQDEREKTYEVGMLTIEGKSPIRSAGVRNRLMRAGQYMGNTAAFLAWLAAGELHADWYASIPEDKRLFGFEGRPSSKEWYAYYEGGAAQELGLRPMDHDLMEFGEDRKVFLGFRLKT